MKYPLAKRPIAHLTLLSAIACGTLGLTPLVMAAPMPVVQSAALTAAGSNAPGGTVTLTAKATSSSGPVLYDWWIQEPNGQWVQEKPWTSQNTYTMKNLQPGSYLAVVQTLTPAQVQAHDWSASRAAQQTINVATSVSITQMTNTTSGVTVGKPVTITAQATNIMNPVYQFWIEENGAWKGTNYSPSDTYTFTPTTSHFEVAVYAKTVQEPKNAGTNLGITPAIAMTPQIFTLAQSNAAAAQAAWQQAKLQASVLSGTQGLIPYTLLQGVPSPHTIAPLIPTTLPANLTVTGAATSLTANSSLLSQAQSIVKPYGATVTQQTLVNGMHTAAQAFMTIMSNDPLAVMQEMAPGAASQFESQVTGLYAGTNSNLASETYLYNESTVVGKASLMPPLGVLPVGGASPTGFPTQILQLDVPLTMTGIVSHAQQSGIQVGEYTVQAGLRMELYRNPLVPGNLAWGVQQVLIAPPQLQKTLWQG